MTRLTPKHRIRSSSAEEVKSAARGPFISRKLETFNVLSGEGLELIERNADTILKETGMEFHGDPEILDIFSEAGCNVQDTRVRFDPGFCRSTVRDSNPVNSWC
ncbi:MAG: trimethylamine methyltransferase family protein [Aestuariivirga sp.]|uniref:trimethylamine methyltransferase family protein n=1 Tax=Aestuariivirga sp. TaxID=2650926 RepID=UPI003019FD68